LHGKKERAAGRHIHIVITLQGFQGLQGNMKVGIHWGDIKRVTSLNGPVQNIKTEGKDNLKYCLESPDPNFF
jgi:hypothetical protein